MASPRKKSPDDLELKRVYQGKWLNFMVFVSVLLQCIDIFFTFIVIALLAHNLEILKKVAETAAKPVITASQKFNSNDKTADEKSRIPPTLARPSLDVESSSSDSVGAAGLSPEEVQRNASETE